jgi:hypothetical protein
MDLRVHSLEELLAAVVECCGKPNREDRGLTSIAL